MKFVLVFTLLIHGLIHLLGFVKAYELAEISALSQPISRSVGVLWLIAAILLALSATLRLINLPYWWLLATAGILLSQILIVISWTDAKFGTIANVLLMLPVVLAFSTYQFNELIKKERLNVVEQTSQSNAIPTKEKIAPLPEAVQKWLEATGSLNQPLIYQVELEQELSMKMKPEEDKWVSAKAKQVFSVDPPAFVWDVEMEMNAFLNVTGRDKFYQGEGEMLIKLESILPMVDVKGHKKINEAALQRYLAEIVWFPSAALSEYIQWQSIDKHSARATLEYQGTQGSGTFYFDSTGLFERFETMRFMDVNDELPTKWVVKSIKTEKRNNIYIPVECEVQWQLEKENWTWLSLRITDINYNKLKE